MNYTKEQFFADVSAEAKALRLHATKEEINKLDFDYLDPHSASRCIYGQMTGNCISPRAVELIRKCCRSFFKIPVSGLPVDEGFSAVSKYVDTEPVVDFVEDRKRGTFWMSYYSSMEIYIMLPEGKNENLIAYLRGDREDLVL